MRQIIATTLMLFLLCSATACGKTSSEVFEPLNAESKDATEITAQANAEVYQLLDFSDEQESEFASRGFIAAPDSLVIQAENGMTIWSQDAYDFVRKNNDAPTSVNPSLWRNTQYNTRYGLFQVSDDIYQVRGYDISNITFVRSKNGWIIMDCGSSRYTAAEALKFFRSQMGDDRIVMISDSMMAIGLDDGEYSLGGQKVFVKGNKATLKDGTIAGSVTNLYNCFVNAVLNLGVSLESAVKACTINPARALKIDDRVGEICEGKRADLLVVDKNLKIKEIILRGSILKRA